MTNTVASGRRDEGLVCRHRVLKEALTGDHHFGQAGFTPLLKPQEPSRLFFSASPRLCV